MIRANAVKFRVTLQDPISSRALSLTTVLLMMMMMTMMIFLVSTLLVNLTFAKTSLAVDQLHSAFDPPVCTCVEALQPIYSTPFEVVP